MYTSFTTLRFVGASSRAEIVSALTARVEVAQSWYPEAWIQDVRFADERGDLELSFRTIGRRGDRFVRDLCVAADVPVVGSWDWNGQVGCGLYRFDPEDKILVRSPR